MSKFQKIKNFGSSATVVSYAYFQAFKFPDSMNVHFQCVIQVCRYNCPEPVCPEENQGQLGGSIPSQATVTVTPVFNGNQGLVDDGDTYVVNPRTPDASRRNFRHAGLFRARSGRENEELFHYSDELTPKHNYNQYYQSFHNHRVKRHEVEMKKSNVGEVKTNSSVQVLYQIFP